MNASRQRRSRTIVGVAATLAIGSAGCNGSPAEPGKDRFVEMPFSETFEAQLVQSTSFEQSPEEVQVACGVGSYRYNVYQGEGRFNGNLSRIEYRSCVDLATMESEDGIASVVTVIVEDDRGELCADHVKVTAYPSIALEGMLLWSVELMDPMNAKEGEYAEVMVDVVWTVAEAPIEGLAWIRLEGAITEDRSLR